MNPITSHRHGKGRFAWGPAEKCMECVAEKARDEARIQWAKEYREEQEAKKVNALLSNEKSYTDDQLLFSPSWGEIGTVGLLVLMWLVLGVVSYAGVTR